MKCVPIGKASEPDPGADKWVLKTDHSVEALYKEFEDVAAGGWRNKVPILNPPITLCVAKLTALHGLTRIQFPCSQALQTHLERCVRPTAAC